MRINSYHVCEALDWIPLVSTIAQAVHAIAKARFKNGLESAYGDYLKKYTFTQKCLIACPIVNIVIKTIEGLIVLINSPENIPPRILPYSKKNNRDFMLWLRQSNPYSSYCQASYTLRNDKEFALTAVSQNTWIYNFLPDALKQDRDIALAAVTKDAWLFESLPKPLQKDHKIALAVVTKRATIFWSLSEQLQKDREIALAAMSQNFWLFDCLSRELQEDREFALAAVTKHPQLFLNISHELQQDPAILAAHQAHQQAAP